MFHELPDVAFDMDKPIIRDTSKRDYQYYSYSARNPNERGRIELQIQDTSRYFLPAEACIEVEGQILRADNNNPYDAGVNIGFVNNGIMALFDSARYLIDGKEIEVIHKDLDVATTIIGLARYSDDFTRSAGPTMMFAKDNSNYPEDRQYQLVQTAQATAVDPQPNGFDDRPGAVFSILRSTYPNFNLGYKSRKIMLRGNQKNFSCIIPLSHIFGFCRNVRKVIYGAKHTVVLQRKGNDDDALWKTADRPDGTVVVPNGQVVLSKLSLWMPSITPSFDIEERLNDFMTSGGKSPLSWGSVTTDTVQSTFARFTWHISAQQGINAPRNIFVALQNRNRLGSQEHSHMIFDNLGVTNVSLRINAHTEPSEDILINYPDNHIARVYYRLMYFMGRDQNVDTGLQISQYDFHSLYPIYYFSLEHLDLTKQSVIDLHFRAELTAAGPLDYRAIAVIISDKSMLLEGVSGRMRMIEAPVEGLI